MNNKVFRMKMTDGSEENCVIIAEFINQNNGKNFVFYTLEKELGKEESAIYTAIKRTTPNGEVLDQIIDPEDLAFAKEMYDSIEGLQEEEDK